MQAIGIGVAPKEVTVNDAVELVVREAEAWPQMGDKPFFIMAIANEFGIPMPHVSNAIAANFDSGTTQKYAVEVVVMIISIVIDVFVFPLLQSGQRSESPLP